MTPCIHTKCSAKGGVVHSILYTKCEKQQLFVRAESKGASEAERKRKVNPEKHTLLDGGCVV